MNISIEIERISNGFVVTEDGIRKYYPSMVKIAEEKIMTSMEMADNYFRECDSEGQTRLLNFSVQGVI